MERVNEQDKEGLWDLIWKNQHPADCSKARFLVHFRGVGGFGYQIHLLARELEYAVRSNRVLLFAGIWIFTDPELCPKRDHECYFQPLSSCTLADIAPGFDAEAPPPPECTCTQHRDGVVNMTGAHTYTRSGGNR